MPKLLGRAVSVVSICVFLLALLVLRRELQETSLTEITAAASSISWSVLASAVLLVIFNYVILTGYDVLALRYLRTPIPYFRMMMAAFICHAFGNNLGASVLTGGSVRYHLYRSKGLSGGQVLTFISFSLLTFWLGFLTLAGFVFVFFPPPLPPQFALPLQSVRPLGLVFLLLVGGYVFWSASGKSPICIHGHTMTPPPPRYAGLQILIASCEWLLSSMVLYLILPGHPLPYLHLLGVFLVAHLAGLASQVPGGLGVFESVVLALLPASVPASVGVASLIVFRCVHNLLPLTAAAALFAIREAVYGGKSLWAMHVHLARTDVRKVGQNVGKFDQALPSTNG